MAAEKAIDYIDPQTGQHTIAKYESFCIDYAQHFDRDLALAAAGYPLEKKTQRQISQAFADVMQRQDVRIRVRALIRQKSEHMMVGPDWVVMKWMEVLDRCMQATPVRDKKGEPTGEWQFDSRGAGAVLHDMANYFNMFNKTKRESKPVRININYGPAPKAPIDGTVEVIEDD
jgi:hypothetical protein